MAFQVKRIKRDKIFRVIADQLEGAISAGQLKPGDKLPPEVKLTEMFAASRSSVREAIRVLEQKGLVEIKRGAGGGVFVRKMDTRKVTESFLLFLQSRHVRFDQMAEFREVMEGEVTALAARRATPQRVENLQRILAQAKNILVNDAGNWRGFYELDIEFHIEIGRIADNPVFSALLSILHRDILGSDDRFALPDRNLMAQNYRDLEKITAAVAAGDPRQAQQAAKDHVKGFNRHMKSREEMFARPKVDFPKEG